MKLSKELKVAIVTDWMYGPGGSDRFVTQVMKVFPNATIFTAYFDKSAYEGRFEVNVPVMASFIQKLPFTRKLHRHYNLFTPVAFEGFDFIGYDLVISLSAGAAKGVITGVDQPHVSLILTPPRSLWDQESNVRSSKLKFIYAFFGQFVSNYLRIWDLSAVERADLHFAISNYIARKIDKVYRKKADVVYPGLDSWWFDADIKKVDSKIPKSYFLVVSRLFDYKRVDWAIKACQKNGQDLLIVGEGPDRPYLETWVGDRIRFMGNVTDPELKYLYKNAQALIFPGIEDYGYTPLEAMTQGTPVIAYNEGGVTETVVEGKTGEFFNSEEELHKKLANFEKLKYNETEIIKNARRFSEKKFQQDFIKKLEDFYNQKTD